MVIPKLPKVIFITGPTASGKTSALHQCLDHFNRSGKDYAVINADSRLFYRDFNIGTAKPTSEELVRYHYEQVNFLAPDQSFTAYDFSNTVKSLISIDRPTFIVGGSTFYLDVLLNGLPKHPTIPAKVKDKLQTDYQTYGLPHLVEELRIKDPTFYQIVDRQNPRRVLRALEVIRSGHLFSALRSQRERLDLNISMITLIPPREELYLRIAERVEIMFNHGWVEEVQALLERFNKEELTTANIIGYREIIEHLQEPAKNPLEEIKLRIIQKTRQLAKRQITWLKKNRTDWLLYLGYNNKTALKEFSSLDHWVMDANDESKTIFLEEVWELEFNQLIKEILK